MGRFKTEKIYYKDEEIPPEELIFWGNIHASDDPKVTISIAAHLFHAAYKNHDDDLLREGEKLMSAANSPCRFIASINAEQATDENNRPSQSSVPPIPYSYKEKAKAEEAWDSSRDVIFDMKIRPQQVKKAMDGVESEKVSGRPYYFVAFTVLKILKYIPLNTSPRDFLLWVNLQYHCGWSEDPQKKHQLSFRLQGTIKELSKKHPSEWKNVESWGDMAMEYHKLAVSFKNAFTQTLVNGILIDNSESFNMLTDRKCILRGAIEVNEGEYYAPDDAFINLAHKH
ncbi:MAG: hypothetical protein IJ886_02475 [Prevotella sp.]|nr:hypothetical protein [Prevotella sp.]